MITSSWPGHFNLSVAETIMELCLTAQRPGFPSLMSLRSNFAPTQSAPSHYCLVLHHRWMNYRLRQQHDLSPRIVIKTVLSMVIFKVVQRSGWTWNGDANVA